jgi:regulatory protein YycI of two-component signal transduction system YycFG
MDWNKTKTIFIIVFSILNVFLYSLYLNRHNEAQKLEPLGEASIAEQLQAENIRYDSLSVDTEKESYVTGKVRLYSLEELKPRENQTFEIIDKTKLVATFDEPVPILNVEAPTYFEEFVIKNVENGSSYELWEINEEERKAVLFQKMKDRFIFYNLNAAITIYWNEDNEIIKYEQAEFKELEEFPESIDLLPEEDAVVALFKKNLLKPDSTITDVILGYSTLVQFTETQVFAPTWRVRAKLKDGSIEDYFVNAVEGKIIEFEKEPEEIIEVE